jgi:hypothetical protein
MDSNISDFYYDKLASTNNPISLFVGMFSSLFNIDEKEYLYPIFAKLYRVYSKDIIYFSILDSYDVNNFNTKDPYGLLVYFCKKRLESRYNFNTMPNLDKLAESVLNKKQRKTEIKTPRTLKEDNE